VDHSHTPPLSRILKPTAPVSGHGHVHRRQPSRRSPAPHARRLGRAQRASEPCEGTYAVPRGTQLCLNSYIYIYIYIYIYMQLSAPRPPSRRRPACSRALPSPPRPRARYPALYHSFYHSFFSLALPVYLSVYFQSIYHSIFSHEFSGPGRFSTTPLTGGCRKPSMSTV